MAENSFEQPKIKPNPESLKEFKEKLKGWMTSEGEDYCPKCWQKYLNQFETECKYKVTIDMWSKKEQEKIVNLREIAQKESTPTADIAKTRKASDGWYVSCSGWEKLDPNCKEQVSVKS